MRSLLAILGLLWLGGCATGAQRPSSEMSVCDFDEASQTLRLVGATDARMLACVEQVQDRAVTTVRLTSRGGNVDRALDIAEVIDRWQPHIVVERECNSSCANYFLPVASRVTLSPGAMILLHGSIDPGFVNRIEDPDRRAVAQATAERQAVFAEEHGIAPGWLLIRQSYEGGTLEETTQLEGGLLRAGPFFRRLEFLLVNEPLFRSCLPHVELDPFVDTVANYARDRWRTRWLLAWQNVFVADDLRCVQARREET